MKTLIPCGGRSSRFPNMPPKWMLPDHDGIPMVVRAVEGLQVPPQDIIISILKEHEDRFDARSGINRAFGRQIETVILDQPTRSQSETVAVTLRKTGINEPFLVKDSDNYFALDPVDATYNYVSVASLNDFDYINPRNKSYCISDQENIILSVREKKVISDTFSVGGYFFLDPQEFLQTFDDLSSAPTVSTGELYISEIISSMLLRGSIFKSRRVMDYRDWGTIHEWRRKLEARKLYFVSVDGFLFERGSAHFSPAFSHATPNVAAVDAVKSLAAHGHSVVYLSIRPKALEEDTKAALASLGLPTGPLLTECGVAQWTIVTAPETTLPFTSSRAIELSPSDENIEEKLIGLA